LVSGAALETAFGGDEGMWLAVGCAVVAAVWVAVRWREVAQWVWGQKSETEPLGLGFGCSVGNSVRRGETWWAVGCAVVAAVWAAVRWHQVARQVGAKNPEPSH
jgi:hypothetical protein